MDGAAMEDFCRDQTHEANSAKMLWFWIRESFPLSSQWQKWHLENQIKTNLNFKKH